MDGYALRLLFVQLSFYTISRIHLTRLAVPVKACTSRVEYDDTLDYNALIFDNIYFPFISTDESFAMTTNT